MPDIETAILDGLRALLEDYPEAFRQYTPRGFRPLDGKARAAIRNATPTRLEAAEDINGGFGKKSLYRVGGLTIRVDGWSVFDVIQQSLDTILPGVWV